MSDRQTLPEALQERLAVAYQRLSEATAGGPLCRAGHGAGLKDAEGRAAALRQAQRVITSGGGAPQLRDLLARWRADDRLGASAPGWRAYLAGGVAELEWVVRQASADEHVTGFA